MTFAAPPILSSLTVAGPSSLLRGLSLNVVNFGDVVPRVSKTYIRSLLALYTERAEHLVDREWNFGEPELWNYGLNVLLLDTSGLDEYNRESGPDLDYNDEGADGDVPYVRAFQVSNEIWKQLAFGSVKTRLFGRAKSSQQ